jgi:hypothetical protein
VKVVECQQGSATWLQARIGHITSSRVCDAIAKLKRKDSEAAARRNLKYELVCELLTNRASENYVSLWMEQGIENEPLARTAYELEHDVEVETVGFVLHPKHPNLRAGCSPDGLIGEDGVAEYKCPKVSTHIQYVEAATIPEEYLPQCMWHLACTERAWVDFSSYNPLVPHWCQLFTKRLYRDDKIISAMELEVEQLQSEVDGLLDKIRQRNREGSLYIQEHEIANA